MDAGRYRQKSSIHLQFSQSLLFAISIICLGAGVILFLLAVEKSKVSISHISLLSYPVNVEDEIVGLLNSANRSIDVEVYIFTNERLAEALVGAKARGVNVRVILGSGEGKEVQDVLSILSMAGIPFRIGAGGFKLVHAKYAIIDGRIVLIGSHNWSRSAMTSNREVSIMIEDSRLAEKLLTIFENDWYS